MKRWNDWMNLALCAAWLSCGASPRRVNLDSPDSQGNPLQATEPRQKLKEIHQHLKGQGYAPTGPAMHGKLGANGIVAYSFTAKTGFCYTAVAIGEEGQDLNIVVIDPSGQTIAHDVNPDEHPWVSVCPRSEGRTVVRLQMAQSSGDFYYASFEGPPDVQPNLHAFFGLNATDLLPAAEVDSETQRRIEALDQRLAVEALQRVDTPKGLDLATDESQQYDLNLLGGTCYAFAVLGSSTARHIEASLVDRQGNEVARHSDPTEAIVRYCSEQSASHLLRIRLLDGQSKIFTLAYAKQVAPSPAGTNPGVMANTARSGSGLEESYRLMDADIRARGYERQGKLERGELQEQETNEFSLVLEGGKCFAVVAVGDNNVRDLDLMLYDLRGKVVDKDFENSPRATTRMCPSQSGKYRMLVKMPSGTGSFAYALYRWPRGTQGPFGLSGLQYVRLAEATALLRVEGFTPDPNYSLERGSLRKQGSSENHSLELEGGACYAVVVVGEQGLNDVDLNLVGSGSSAADSSRNAFPSVRACARKNDTYKLHIQAANGSGKYIYQIFKQTR